MENEKMNSEKDLEDLKEYVENLCIEETQKKTLEEKIKQAIHSKKNDLKKLNNNLEKFCDSKLSKKQNKSITKKYNTNLLTNWRKLKHINLEIKVKEEELKKLEDLHHNIALSKLSNIDSLEKSNKSIEEYFSIINSRINEKNKDFSEIAKMYLEFFRNLSPAIFFITTAIILFKIPGKNQLYNEILGFCFVFFSVVIFIINCINLILQLFEKKFKMISFVIFIIVFITSIVAIFINIQI